MSFDHTDDAESVIETFGKLMEDFGTFEAAVEERVKHLLKTHVTVSAPENDAAYQKLLKLFSLGYQCGWKDCKNFFDEIIA